MTQRFEKKFAALRGKNEGLFVPFVTLGDPGFDDSLEILRTLVKSGADALELGFPFSDPCADGPVIQKADKRALQTGISTDDLFALIRRLRDEDDEIPISILVYANVVVARGIDRFYADCAASGIDAVLIPDIPVGMLHTCEDFQQCAQRHDVDMVLIAPPNADEKTLEAIASASQGYTYVLSRFGITGTEKPYGKPVQVIKTLHHLKSAGTLLGFGISTPDHVRDALSCGVDGVIAGSGVVRVIEENLGSREAMLKAVSEYVRAMKHATLPD